MTNPLKRGEIWLADLNPTQGSEQAGINVSDRFNPLATDSIEAYKPKFFWPDSLNLTSLA